LKPYNALDLLFKKDNNAEIKITFPKSNKYFRSNFSSGKSRNRSITRSNQTAVSQVRNFSEENLKNNTKANLNKNSSC